MVIDPALQRAGITSTGDATEAAKKAAVFFDDYERVQHLCVSSAGAT